VTAGCGIQNFDPLRSGSTGMRSPLPALKHAVIEMPRDNQFQHQAYSDACPQADYELIQSGDPVDPDSDEFITRMQTVGDQMRRAGVGRIVVVHGTFVGQDLGSVWTELSRWFPGFGDAMLDRSKAWVDSLVGEFGNFTPRFVELLDQGLNRPGQPAIQVELFNWSGENHHVGRADGAIRLLDHLLKIEGNERIVLWGHSHGGNVFALLSNLLAQSSPAVDRFFDAARHFFRSPQQKTIDIPVWPAVRKKLSDQTAESLSKRLDIVTYGTPIRYGWETDGYSKLLHIIYHLPTESRAEYLAEFPPTAAAMLQATRGDVVQQIGIAGTNVAPNIAFWRTWSADRSLNALLQPPHSLRQLRGHLQCGMRVASEGLTLLVDYGSIPGILREHHAGHAVYTLAKWLVFHSEQVARRFYS